VRQREFPLFSRLDERYLKRGGRASLDNGEGHLNMAIEMAVTPNFYVAMNKDGDELLCFDIAGKRYVLANLTLHDKNDFKTKAGL
jgi:hypothetical protein